MNYLYETHLHTVSASACSDTEGRDYIDFMMAAGYNGMIVTDHFFNGNSCIPAQLPWEERVERYCSGYRQALSAAEGKDFTVLFGIEFNFECDEFLLYGMEKEWLLVNPDMLEWSREELYDSVHRAGGIMIQAHPFRERNYIRTIHLTPSVCDGAEIYNSGNPDWQNALAYQYAAEHGFLPSAGSDIHHLTQKEMGGMLFPYRIHTIQDYVRGFLRGDGVPVFCRDITAPGSRFQPVKTEPALTVTERKPTLPVVFH
ncbi:MAG: hypothetical protein IKN79_08645 [Eubacterium sp.]|nr:hypothetical protein [Eubacterium sp.]